MGNVFARHEGRIQTSITLYFFCFGLELLSNNLFTATVLICSYHLGFKVYVFIKIVVRILIDVLEFYYQKCCIIDTGAKI